MSSIEIEIDSEEMTGFLSKLERGTNEIIGEITSEIGEAIFSESQRICPVQSGVLKKSGYRRKETGKFVLGYRAPYAAYVEFGTRKMRPRAYIRGALIKILPRATKIAEKTIDRYLKRIRG